MVLQLIIFILLNSGLIPFIMAVPAKRLNYPLDWYQAREVANVMYAYVRDFNAIIQCPEMDQMCARIEDDVDVLERNLKDVITIEPNGQKLVHFLKKHWPNVPEKSVEMYKNKLNWIITCRFHLGFIRALFYLAMVLYEESGQNYLSETRRIHRQIIEIDHFDRSLQISKLEFKRPKWNEHAISTRSGNIIGQKVKVEIIEDIEDI